MIKNPAIVLIDVQNDFFTGRLKTHRVKNIIEPLQRLLAVAQNKDVPTIYCIDAHYPQDVEVTRKWALTPLKARKVQK